MDLNKYPCNSCCLSVQHFFISYFPSQRKIFFIVRRRAAVLWVDREYKNVVVSLLPRWVKLPRLWLWKPAQNVIKCVRSSAILAMYPGKPGCCSVCRRDRSNGGWQRRARPGNGAGQLARYYHLCEHRRTFGDVVVVLLLPHTLW